MFRNLHKWVEMLKSELPYYETCNTGDITLQRNHVAGGLKICFIPAGIEMFRAWAKSKNRSYSSKGK